MFVGGCFITLWENPRLYPWMKIFSYGLPTQDHGEGREVVNVRNLLRPWCVRIIKIVARRALRPLCLSWHVKSKTNYYLVLIMSVEKFFVSRDRHIEPGQMRVRFV